MGKKYQTKTMVITMLPVLAFLFSLWLVVAGVKAYLEHASYFKIKRVVLNGIDDKTLAQHISRTFIYDNIFNLDLKYEREVLKNTNPQFYDVDVVKNFPDQVTINAIVRRPVSQIRHRGYFLVDSDGVVVSDISVKPFDEVIVLSVLKWISSLSFGKKIHWQGLKTGLMLTSLLKGMRQDLISFIPQLASEKIEIDLSKSPSFYVHIAGIEVRLYDSDLESKLKLLLKILPTIKDRLGEVKYIDLRFAEPVVSFKNKK